MTGNQAIPEMKNEALILTKRGTSTLHGFHLSAVLGLMESEYLTKRGCGNSSCASQDRQSVSTEYFRQAVPRDSDSTRPAAGDSGPGAPLSFRP